MGIAVTETSTKLFASKVERNIPKNVFDFHDRLRCLLGCVRGGCYRQERRRQNGGFGGTIGAIETRFGQNHQKRKYEVEAGRSKAEGGKWQTSTRADQATSRASSGQHGHEDDDAPKRPE